MRLDYDLIGEGYSRNRRTDPRIAGLIWAALGDACSVLNVGAGTGSYEPENRDVVAIEPSRVMIRQRPAGAAPAIQGRAEELPLEDSSVDAAMAIFSIHHWSDPRLGVAEMRRVARGPVVIATYDAPVAARLWVSAQYLPELGALHRKRFPAIDECLEWLGGGDVQAIPVPADCVDHFVEALWARPALVFDRDYMAATSAYAALGQPLVDRARKRLLADLESGEWLRHNAELLNLSELDVGLRLIVST